MTAQVQPLFQPDEQTQVAARLDATFRKQRRAYLAQPVPDIAQRKQDLRQLLALFRDHREAIIAAIHADYGSRSRHESQFADIISVTDGIHSTLKHLKSWARPQRRHVDLTMYAGARNRVIPQPLGVVGIIVPWNFPMYLAFGPLTAAFAAGNRAMIKMSENSRNLSRLLQQIVPDYFPEEKLAIFEETGGVGIAFSKIPFDLLMFTGSGETGRKVMESAAKNLTPVILELGGKSPAVIDRSFPLATAVERIMFIKQFNAGQICLNVDYVFVHESQVEAFIEHADAYVDAHCPDIQADDYTAIIDDRSFARLQGTLDDARRRGARVIALGRGQKADPVARKMPLHLVLDTDPAMTIWQRETSGPILMVMPYRDHEEVIAYINAHDRPLGLYPFAKDRKVVDMYIQRTMSGGVTVNDALYHIAQHDLPFGGVGPSGMGHYHGREGFMSFSKLRPVFYQAPFSFMKLLQPPYGRFASRVYDFLMKWKG